MYSGEYLKLMAVVAKDGREMLNQKEIEDNTAFSRPVYIITRDDPPIQVKINRIDRQPVEERKALQVYRVSGIEGEVYGRPLEEDDKVWVLKMHDDKNESWELLGRAAFRNKHQWALPPLPIGESGEQIILVAVVSKSQIRDLNLDEQGHVLAASRRVHIRLTN